MHRVVLIGLFCVNVSAAAAPPPGSDGRFREWFRGLSMPGSPGTMCCTVADCRMVDHRWNDQARRYEARVTPQVFSNALRRPTISQPDEDAVAAAISAWMQRWAARYGESSEVWIEIPDSRVSRINNPTGLAVLCWSVFNREFNGVYCFVPFSAAANVYGEGLKTYV
jgi:hypothetical protein